MVKLTPNQIKAVEYGGRNLQLIACAGSGKTEVVALRVVQLLTPGRAQSLLPRNIVAFTFTEKAAAELKERIVTRTREALGDLPGMAEMFVGTIHAFCLELLKSESPKYLKYEVLNEVQQTLFVDRHSKVSGLTQSTTLTGQTLKRFTDTRHYISTLNILREDQPIAPAQLNGNTVVAKLPGYEKLLHDRGYLDYSSIIKEAVAELIDVLE
jgi:DNA helicase II / ATP-dependent DNA helicase PcrA